MKRTDTPTYLRVLNNCLAGRNKKIFPNQVVFYNVIFGATNPLVLPNEFLEEINHISRESRKDTDEFLQKQIHFLLFSGLDRNSSNVGKHINNAPELPIPTQHKAHLLNEPNRSDIVWRLQTVIRFCLVLPPKENRMETSDFQRLLIQMKRKFPEGLIEASRTLRETDELSVELLSNVIYEVVISHLERLEGRNYFAPEGKPRVSVDMAQQLREYKDKVDCYGISNADRFFAMKRLAEKNVVTANELACVYYYGNQYFTVDEGGGSDGIYQVESNRKLAVQYYKKAVSCEPMVLDACWSLGYMIWNHMFTDIREEERESLALSYFLYAMEHDFLPAYNSVGMIEIAKGDRLLEEERQLREQGKQLPEHEREEMLSHYCRGLELCDRAGCEGWVYGHNNVADFMAGSRYMDEIWPELRKRIRLQGPAGLRERWRAAADMGNLWAMNNLAILECQSGNIPSALELWSRAAEYSYPTANLNLALYLYGPDCPRADKQQYQLCLEQASADGSSRASCELAELYLKSNPFMANMLLSRAEEQNFKKFDNKIYHRIKEMRDSIQK